MSRNVQVTLQILAALLEKSHKDFALIAPYVLKVLDMVLRSSDITMIESSLPTFEAFCEHHDATSLTADQVYLRQYEDVVRLYAQLASSQHIPSKGPVSRPVQTRWRNAGLEALRSIATADALASVTGRQMDLIVPMILENIWTDNEDVLDVLLQRVQAEEKVDSEKPLRRRTSVATVGTVDTNGDTNPVAMTGTALDVDKLAEEEIGVLAMQCLKSILVVPNRSQIHSATASFLRFVLERVNQGESVVTLHENRERDSGWAIKLYNIMARWAPMQDRYAILVATMDTLLRIPVKEDNLIQQVSLTAMMGSLLRSDVNLIGLSVMDVLLGLIRQMRKLFRLPVKGSQSELVDGKGISEAEQGVNLQWQDLLLRLEQCIGDLATHVYYADQISDMISAIIVRLKPSRTTSASPSPHGEKTEGNEDAPDSSAPELNDSPSQLDSYFTLNAGRVSALGVIKAILLVANPQKKLSGNLALSRNRVPIQVWEGTHWLLRDPDGKVRKAYLEALVTWLERETTFADLQAKDENFSPRRSSIKNSRDLHAPSGGRRAVSNASNRERNPKARRSQFLPLLHLAIYDNAMQYIDYDNDIVGLHILLTKLAFKLGVNAAQCGIPMVYRLQEEIQDIEIPIHKVRIAALCHGYFWALSEVFELDGSAPGRAINNEIVRRRSKGFWVEGIHVPPPPLESFGLLGQPRSPPQWDPNVLESEELLPFDDRASLVENIATSYLNNSQSPPTSPTASPGRSFNGPILGNTISTDPPNNEDLELPASYREQMLADWSRDAAAAALASAVKAESMTGSRTGTSVTRGRLTINTAGGINGNGHLLASPFGSLHNLRPHSSHAHGERERALGSVRLRKNSVRSGISPPVSVGSRTGVASVEQLKMVLSGNMSPKTAGAADGDDDSGESMVSYEYSASEGSAQLPTTQSDYVASPTSPPQRSLSGSRRGPLSAGSSSREGTSASYDNEGEQGEEDVPPVPPLPNLSNLAGNKGDYHAADIATQDHAFKSTRRNVQSRGGESAKSRSVRSQTDSGRIVDLDELLRGIDSYAGEGSLGNVTRPPY